MDPSPADAYEEPLSSDDADERRSLEFERYHASLAAGTADIVSAGRGKIAASADEASIAGGDPEVAKGIRCLQLLERVRRDGLWDDTADAGDMPAEGDHAQCIGRFELREELGRGGQGVVFLAWDPKLEREVALKVPRPELLMTRDMRRRFLREGRAAAGLNHPHIVAVYEAGEAGPVCYIAQEYCRGGSLAAWLKATKQPLDFRAAAALACDLADAVEHAHAHGILHRDLKPSNVLLTDDSSAEPAGLQPKLTDFGLAKALEQEGDETATGAILGTAAYMPPEQAAGRYSEIGLGADVYGLGAILYELLTGRAPFIGPSPLEILRQVAADEPARPRTIRRNIPRDLEAICLRCLEKSPAHRYGTAGILADDLRRFLQGEPTLARPATTAERTFKWARRNPWIATLTTAILLSLVVLATTVTLYTVQLRAALADSERSRQTMRLHLYASDIRSAQVAWEVNRVGECVNLLRRQTPTGSDPELREFCWGYLWNQTHQSARELHGHRGAVYTVEFSPDGQILATAGEGGVVRIWEPATGKLLHELIGHESDVNALAFSPDGRQMATVSDLGELFLWSVGDKFRLQRQTSLSPSELYCVQFSPSGEQLAVSGFDRVVRLVSITDGAVLRQLTGHTGPVNAVRFWQDGQHLVSGGKEGKLLDWDLTNNDTQAAVLIDDPTEPIYGIDFSADKSRLAVARSIVEIYQFPAMDRLSRISRGEGIDSSVRLSRDGKEIVCAKHDSTWWIGRWAQGNKGLRTVAGHAGRLYAAVFSPDGQRIATAGADGTVRLWSTESGGLAHEVTAEVPAISGGRFSAAGDCLLLKLGSERDPLRLASYAWDGSGWSRGDEWKSEERSSAVTCAISNHGKWIIRTAPAQQLLAWQHSVSQDWKKVGCHDSEIGDVAFVPERDIALSTSKGTLRAWNLTTCEMLWEAKTPLQDSGGRIQATSKTICFAAGYELAVYDVATGHERLRLAVPGIEIQDVAITPDERELMAAGSDRSIYRWRLPGGQPLEPWVGHETGVDQLTVHPDGRTVASLDHHGVLKLWHRPTGQVLLTMNESLLNAIAYSADGHRLYVVRRAGQNATQIWSYNATTPKMTRRD